MVMCLHYIYGVRTILGVKEGYKCVRARGGAALLRRRVDEARRARGDGQGFLL